MNWIDEAAVDLCGQVLSSNEVAAIIRKHFPVEVKEALKAASVIADGTAVAGFIADALKLLEDAK